MLAKIATIQWIHPFAHCPLCKGKISNLHVNSIANVGSSGTIFLNALWFKIQGKSNIRENQWIYLSFLMPHIYFPGGPCI